MKKIKTIIIIIALFVAVNAYCDSNGLDFDGTGDYACIPDNSLFDVNAVTIELWFNWDVGGTEVDFLTAKSTEELEIHLSGSSNGIRFIPTTGVYLDTPANTFTPGSWVHLACVYDPAQSLGKIYVNGADAGAVNNGGNPLNTAIIHSASEFSLGRRGNGTYSYDGKLDEVRIWNYARSQAQIQTNLHNILTGSESGLAAYWPLDALEDLGIKGDGADDFRDNTVNSLHGDTEGPVLTAGAPLNQFTDIGAGLTGVDRSSVAWGDYDNDGDLDILLTGYLGSGIISKIYRNDAGTFVDINAGLTGVRKSTAAWGDYDNDGDLDILLTGERDAGGFISKIYRNDAGTFTYIDAGLQGGSSAAWGDYDNDGDLDILLTGEGDIGGFISKIYRNDAGTFVDINAGLTGVRESTAAWGDYDNDGDLDILITGDSGSSYISKVYRNDSETFVDINAGLTGVWAGSAAWGDYDNDGDLDILLTGDGGAGGFISKIYRNNNGIFEVAASLTGVMGSSSTWGDYDNDGDLDILLTGTNSSLPPNPGISIVYRNDNGTFNDSGIVLNGAYRGSVAWGDYDNDDDLDILMTGATNMYMGFFTKIYRNNNLIPNTIPSAPANLTAVTSENSAAFSWNASSDNETPSAGLTYNLRVGTTSGGNEMFSSMAKGDGWRKIPKPGSQNHNTAWTLNGPFGGFQLPMIYWSVQAIDHAFAGSSFAAEQSFGLVYPKILNDAELLPDGTLFWQTRSVDYISHYQLQIDNNSNFSSPEVNNSVSLSKNAAEKGSMYFGVQLDQLTSYGNLQDNTVYYWRMKPVYNNGWESVYTIEEKSFFFNKVNNAPNPPYNGFSPANDTAISNLTPSIFWYRASDPDLSDTADDVKYNVQLSTSNAFTSLAYNDVTQYGQTYIQIMSCLLSGYRYYYRIKTIDNGLAESDWSATQQFIVLGAPLDIAITDSGSGVTVSWNAVPVNSKGVLYNIYSSNVPDAAFPSGWKVEAINLSTTSWNDVYTTSVSKKFYRVTAVSGAK